MNGPVMRLAGFGIAYGPRVVLRDVLVPGSKKDEVVVPAGVMLDERLVDKLESLSVDEVWVRSPITCELPFGVCAKCYGRDLARGHIVNAGEAVVSATARSFLTLLQPFGLPESALRPAFGMVETCSGITWSTGDMSIEKPLKMPKSWISLGANAFRETDLINPQTPEERNGFITFGTAICGGSAIAAASASVVTRACAHTSSARRCSSSGTCAVKRAASCRTSRPRSSPPDASWPMMLASTRRLMRAWLSRTSA